MAKRAQLLVLGGHDLHDLVATAIDAFSFAGRRAVVAVGSRDAIERADAVGQQVAHALKDRDIAVRAIAPANSTVGAWLDVRSRDWASIDVAPRASRLERVWLPRVLDGSAPIVAVNRLANDRQAGEPIALGLWARFAHPRQRTGARLSDLREGLTAEIALAIHPALIILTMSWHDVHFLLATDDQIAAEVGGLALLQRLSATAGEEPIGPWEHPLVQRATELDLGISTPAGIEPEERWLGDASHPDRFRFLTASSDMLARMGIKRAE